MLRCRAPPLALETRHFMPMFSPIQAKLPNAPKEPMFFFRHPKSVVDPRAVVTQVVKYTIGGAVNPHLLIVEPGPAHKNTTPPTAMPDPGKKEDPG
jgi:hypothetical protein